MIFSKKTDASKKVTEYINKAGQESSKKLTKLRSNILSLDKEIVEDFAYAMPAYKYKGKPLIYFGVFKDHIGIYATPQINKQFKKELGRYKTSKGSIQIPKEVDFPYELISKMILFKIEMIKSIKNTN